MIGLTSLHALDNAQGPRIWLATGVTDMRCGFDRLAERVKSVIGQDPVGNSLFVFRSRRGDRLKILTWDRDGFILWYKRLEGGVLKRVRWKASPLHRLARVHLEQMCIVKYHRLQGGGFELRLAAGLIGHAADLRSVLTDAVLAFH